MNREQPKPDQISLFPLNNAIIEITFCVSFCLLVVGIMHGSAGEMASAYKACSLMDGQKVVLFDSFELMVCRCDIHVARMARQILSLLPQRRDAKICPSLFLETLCD